MSHHRKRLSRDGPNPFEGSNVEIFTPLPPKNSLVRLRKERSEGHKMQFASSVITGGTARERQSNHILETAKEPEAHSGDSGAGSVEPHDANDEVVITQELSQEDVKPSYIMETAPIKKQSDVRKRKHIENDDDDEDSSDSEVAAMSRVQKRARGKRARSKSGGRAQSSKAGTSGRGRRSNRVEYNPAPSRAAIEGSPIHSGSDLESADQEYDVGLLVERLKGQNADDQPCRSMFESKKILDNSSGSKYGANIIMYMMAEGDRKEERMKRQREAAHGAAASGSEEFQNVTEYSRINSRG